MGLAGRHWESRQHGGSGKDDEHQRPFGSGVLEPTSPDQNRHCDHDQDSGRLQAQNQAVRRSPQVIEPAQLLGCPQHPGQGRDGEGQECDTAESLDQRAPFVRSPPGRRSQGGEDQDAARPRSGRQNMGRIREDRPRGGIDRGGMPGKPEGRRRQDARRHYQASPSPLRGEGWGAGRE